MRSSPHCYLSRPSPQDQAEYDCFSCAFRRPCLDRVDPTVTGTRRTDEPFAVAVGVFLWLLLMAVSFGGGLFLSSHGPRIEPAPTGECRT